MKFTVNVKGVSYDIETADSKDSPKLSYKVFDGNASYQIALGAYGEWICHDHHHGAYPLPVMDIGEAIQAHFGT